MNGRAPDAEIHPERNAKCIHLILHHADGLGVFKKNL